MPEVLVEVADGVATLTLAAPERRNALTPEMAREVVRACDAIDADQSIGAVVVCGQGPSFCAGAHRDTLALIAADPTRDASYRDLHAVYEAFVRVGELEPPTVAAIRGAAIGAGVNLAFATDLRVLAREARIVPGFARLGFHPGGGHLTLVARTAGREVAAALGLFDQDLDGQRAGELGMAWDVVDADAVEPRAHELAHGAARDPELARAVKRSLHTELGPPGVSWPAALAIETSVQLWSFARAREQRLGR